MSDLKFVISDGAIEAEAAALRHAVRNMPAEYRLDRIIYQVARLQVEMGALHKQIAALRAATASMDLLLPMDQVMRGDGLPSEVTIEADELLNAEAGFYQPEFDPMGRPYRWTGPTNDFGFDLLLNRSAPIIVTVELLGAINETQLEGLLGFCGNVRLNLERTSLEGLHIFSGTIPEDEAGRMTHLRFWVPQVVCPADSLGSSDVRTLGVQFASLKVRKAHSSVSGKPSKARKRRSEKNDPQKLLTAVSVNQSLAEPAGLANGVHAHQEPTL